MKNKKGFAVLPVIIVVVIIAAIVAGVWYFSRESTVAPSGVGVASPQGTSTTGADASTSPPSTSTTTVVAVSSMTLSPSTGLPGTMIMASYQLDQADEYHCPAGECSWVWLQDGKMVEQNISIGVSGSEISVPASFTPGEYELAFWNYGGKEGFPIVEASFTVASQNSGAY